MLYIFIFSDKSANSVSEPNFSLFIGTQYSRRHSTCKFDTEYTYFIIEPKPRIAEQKERVSNRRNLNGTMCEKRQNDSLTGKSCLPQNNIQVQIEYY